MTILGLKECFGAQFPTSSEVDHWMALRGLLFFYSKRQGTGREAYERLSREISRVSDHLRDNLEVDVRNRRQASSELFGHYLNVVSDCWLWLNQLKNLR